MTTTLSGVVTSPVDMENRKELGLKAGDTVRVHQKIQDKGKVRIQMFEGLVLARKHGDEPGATFTVRKVASGVGVEKIFPLYSPNIDKIEIVKRAKVRRAKLYYIRDKVAREIKRQMRRMTLTNLATQSEAEIAVKKELAATKKAEDEAKAEAKKAEADKAAAEAKEAEATATEEVKEEVAVEETPIEEKAEEVVEEKKEETTEEAPVEETKEETEEKKD